jgi:hypothetical protein
MDFLSPVSIYEGIQRDRKKSTNFKHYELAENHPELFKAGANRGTELEEKIVPLHNILNLRVFLQHPLHTLRKSLKDACIQEFTIELKAIIDTISNNTDEEHFEEVPFEYKYIKCFSQLLEYALALLDASYANFRGNRAQLRTELYLQQMKELKGLEKKIKRLVCVASFKSA